MSDNDALIPQFLELTGSTDVNQASNYLEMSGFDLSRAIELFFDHGPSTNNGPENGRTALMEDDVRRPDETRTEQLIGGNHHHDEFVPGSAAAAAFLGADPQLQRLMQSVASAHGGGISTNNMFYDARAAVNAATNRANNMWNDEDNSTSNNSHVSEDEKLDFDDSAEDRMDLEPSTTISNLAPNNLQNLFAPPSDLLFRSPQGFPGARTAAKEQKKWLLVNIQSDSDFACHALNRDVWRHDLVSNLVMEGFLLWQVYESTPDGMTFVQRYNVFGFPHISIIDPRTGRLMWKKEGWTQVNPLDPDDFACELVDFTSRHSLDDPPKIQKPQFTNAKLSSSSSSSSDNGTATDRNNHSAGIVGAVKRPLEDTSSEDGELKAALAASLSDKLNQDATLKDDEAPHTDQKYSTNDLNANSEFTSIVIGDEPSNGAKIQFRMPDGSKFVRKFNLSDEVKIIYAFAMQNNEESKGGREFELRAGYPPKDLYDSLNQTVEECKLAGESVIMKLK